MTKAHFILNYFLSKRRLKSVCLILGDLSYKYVFAIAKQKVGPSANIQTALYPIIAPSYWYQEADENFANLFKTHISFDINSKYPDLEADNYVNIT